MAKLFSKHKLHNLMRYAVGEINISTHMRGYYRLDYALGTERFMLALVQSSYKQFWEQLKTDHCPYFLDFDTKKLFGILHFHSSSDQDWYLHSRDTSKMAQYIKLLNKKLTQQNIFTRMDALFNSDKPDHALVEKLDVLFTTLALKVEYDVWCWFQQEWSHKLLKQRAYVFITMYYMTQFCTQYSHHQSIQHLQQRFCPFDSHIYWWMQSYAYKTTTRVTQDH